jgi:hypothetical protein
VAAISQPVKPKTAQRSIVVTTVGGGKTVTPVTTQQTLPATSVQQKSPGIVRVIGADSQTATVSFGSLTAGEYISLNALVVGFPNIPNNKYPLPTPYQFAHANPQQPAQPFTTKPSDKLLLQVQVQSWLVSSNAVVAGIIPTPQALKGGITYLGPFLQTGQSYSTYQASVVFRLYAPAAVAGGTITTTVNAILFLFPG